MKFEPALTASSPGPGAGLQCDGCLIASRHYGASGNAFQLASPLGASSFESYFASGLMPFLEVMWV